MVREIRLTLYFILGLLLGGYSALSFSLDFKTAAQTAVVIKNAMNGTGMSGVLKFNEAPVFTSTGGGNVAVTTNAAANFTSATGAAVPVTVPIVLTQTLTPTNIASAIITSGGNFPLAAAGLVGSAGLSYLNGKWYKGPATESPDLGLVTTPIDGYKFVGVWEITGTDPVALCKSGAVQWPQYSYHSYEPAPAYKCVVSLRPSTDYYGSMGTMFPTKICPQSFRLEGNSCVRNACVNDEVRNTSGVCVAPASQPMTAAQATALLAVKVQAIDPSTILYAWPSDIDPDPNNGFPQPKAVPVPSVTSAPSVSTTVKAATATSPAVTQKTTTTTKVTSTVDSNNVVTSKVENTTTVTEDGVVKSTTTETPVKDPLPAPEVAVVDTPFPDAPKLYERKYPDGLTGVWRDNIAAIKATPLFSLPQIFAPTVIDGGSCPVWSFSANIGPNMNFGSGSISPPCYIWPILKTIMIIGALLLARALVFGG